MKKRQMINKDEIELFLKWFLKEFQMWDFDTIKETYNPDEIVDLYVKSLK